MKQREIREFITLDSTTFHPGYLAKYWAVNMIKNADQTIRQYAKISEIPLKQALEGLKNSGFNCNADDAVNHKMRKVLSTYFRKRQSTPEGQKEAEKLKRRKDELKNQKIAKALLLKQQKADELERQKPALIEKFKSLIRNPKSRNGKIELLLGLCCELIPADIIFRINNACINKSFQITQWQVDDYGLIREPKQQVNMNTPQNGFIIIYTPHKQYLPLSIEQFISAIKHYKKHNRYTAALIETIYFLLSHEEDYLIFEIYKKLHIVGELFVDMGAIDKAIQLYKIDESFFSNPNNLSLLANKSIQSGNLDDSVKLVSKLIKQEPYHPTIPSLQAEIKRLEQRHRLKATFSIDFSKVNELSGVEFENLLMDKFVALGFRVELTPKTGDFGADLIVENHEGSRIIVQCKRFKSKVNLKAVQEVIGAIGHYAGDMGIVITNNSFLNSAVKLAETHDIELWDGDKLVSFLAGDLSFSQTF
ncbi:restriction endonuclease [Methyloglobulus sp.]|uniref:restriction endonuclease n=1 Tax=Methyloglobulus sp. TaxID=2518622 RepID=UPI003989C126